MFRAGYSQAEPADCNTESQFKRNRLSKCEPPSRLYQHSKNFSEAKSYNPFLSNSKNFINADLNQVQGPDYNNLQVHFEETGDEDGSLKESLRALMDQIVVMKAQNLEYKALIAKLPLSQERKLSLSHKKSTSSIGRSQRSASIHSRNS